MRSDLSVVDQLRRFVIGELHIGHFQEGDRLPTYRDLSRRWGVDHRAVAKAYRVLEEEGLVEIRERQGVFLREQERIGGEMLPDTARWVSDEVLTEAWRRRIKVPDLPEFIRTCTASVQLRCACVESTEDHRRLLCRTLAEWFGFETTSIPAERLSERVSAGGSPVVDASALPGNGRGVDLLVTTGYHAREVRAVAEALEVPHVVVRMHPGAAEAIERRVREGGLTVVCLDPAFGERVRALVGPEGASRVRVILAGDAKALARLDPEEEVLISRATWERVGRVARPLINPNLPAFDTESARELLRLLIRLNLEKSGPSG